MKTEQEKLINFEKIVLYDAISMRENIAKQLEEEKRIALESAKANIMEECNRRYNQEIDRITRKNNAFLIKNNAEHKHALLAKREQLIQDLFEEVENRINDFVQSGNYVSYLQQKIEQARKHTTGDRVTLKLCMKDKEIPLSFDPAFCVEYVTDEWLGGFLLIDEQNNLMIDETFATKLDKQKREFLELCHMLIS